MNDLDSSEFARDLLGRLAATMPDNPGRAAAVQRIVRRRHRRRVATRATLGLTFAAGIGVLVVEGPSRRPQTLPTATSPTPPSDTKSPDTVPTTCADVKKSLPAGSDAATTAPNTDSHRLKATGRVTAVNGDTISVSIETASTEITDVTATISPDASYLDSGATSATRPSLAVGDRIAFGAVEHPDGLYVIDILETHVVDGAHVADPAISSADATKTAAIDSTKLGQAMADCAPPG